MGRCVRLKFQPAHDMDYRTHFERRTRRTNEPVYRAEYLEQ